MRIAMIGSRGIPARSGGIERVVQELAVELTARGHEVLVYGRPWYLRDAGQPTAGQVILTPGLSGKHTDTITHTWTALRDVRRRDVDIVHIHSPGPALLSGMAARAGLPIVLTVHAPDWRREKWSRPARWLLRTGLCNGMKYADAVTSVSQPLSDELGQRFGREIQYIPNGVRPVGDVGDDRLAEMGLESDNYALSVGRIVPEKRLDLLLRAWENVKSDKKLAIIGDVNDSPYGRRCRRFAAQNVVFLGERFGEDLLQLYANTSLVVQPSILEGMSLVLLEAAAHGRCVLAANIPENVAAMEKSILFFKCDDEAELSAEMNRLLKDSAVRRQMGTLAKEHVCSHYRWSDVASEYETVYQAQMKQGPQ